MADRGNGSCWMQCAERSPARLLDVAYRSPAARAARTASALLASDHAPDTTSSVRVPPLHTQQTRLYSFQFRSAFPPYFPPCSFILPRPAAVSGMLKHGHPATSIHRNIHGWHGNGLTTVETGTSTLFLFMVHNVSVVFLPL